jgi:hypothetical protein
MSFSDLLSEMDVAIDDHLRDAAILRPAAGGPDLPIRAALERPEATEDIGVVNIVRPKPWVEISLRLAPELRKGDHVLMGASAPWEGWKIAGTPTRPGDGRHWRAEVEPLGQVLA